MEELKKILKKRLPVVIMIIAVAVIAICALILTSVNNDKPKTDDEGNVILEEATIEGSSPSLEEDVEENGETKMDPQATNFDKSDAYIFAEVTIPTEDINGGHEEIYTYEINENWIEMTSTNAYDALYIPDYPKTNKDGSVTHLYAYAKYSSGSAKDTKMLIVNPGNTTKPLFDTITSSTDATVDDLSNIVTYYGAKVADIKDTSPVAVWEALNQD